MICQGFERELHKVEKLYGRGPYCQACYMKKYRKEHATELKAYRKAYRSDPVYKELNKVYSTTYREKQHDISNKQERKKY
jgi:hypothetical protein